MYREVWTAVHSGWEGICWFVTVNPKLFRFKCSCQEFAASWLASNKPVFFLLICRGGRGPGDTRSDGAAGMQAVRLVLQWPFLHVYKQLAFHTLAAGRRAWWMLVRVCRWAAKHGQVFIAGRTFVCGTTQIAEERVQLAAWASLSWDALVESCAAFKGLLLLSFWTVTKEKCSILACSI